MADSIGAYGFITLEGDLSPPTTKLQDISRDGVEGFAYRAMPAKSRETMLTGVAIAASAAAADSLMSGYASLVGTTQSVLLRSITYSVFIVDVEDFDRRVVYGTTGFVWRVESRWTVRFVG